MGPAQPGTSRIVAHPERVLRAHGFRVLVPVAWVRGGEERKLPWETVAWRELLVAWVRLVAAGWGEVWTGLRNVWGLELTGSIDRPGGTMGKSHRGKLVDRGLRH